MCAIAGIIGLGVTEEIIEKMMKTMERRGPDEHGIYRRKDTVFLHTRLTIIDPSSGKQPMQLAWKDENYTIIYNGELYNTEEIRNMLKKKGHFFNSHSDTEALLHAYAQWGAECLEKLNGIFSFAVYEEKRNRVFLARDRIGVKPLFYMLHRNGLLFASEIKTILQYPTVSAQLDTQGAMQLIMLGPGRLPGSGVFRNIYEVEPGCYGYYEDGHLQIRQYWKLRDREHRENFEETAEIVRFLVTDSIQRQMVSDVPIGTFLSGGLDSSIITAVCAGEKRKKGETLDTFSVDYLNNDQFFVSNKFQPESDSAYIHLMQKEMATDHHWTILTPEDLLQGMEEATIARDLPGMADVDFSLFAFCKEIRENVKVALSGECADEIFGGYPWYRDPEIRSAEGFPWAQNVNQRAGILADAIKSSENPFDFIHDAYRTTCMESDILPCNSSTERRMKEMVNLNFRWFMQTLLDRKDRMSMFHSLEVRVPFCDYRIAEYLYAIPWEYKDYQGREKGLLRKAVEGIIPDAVLYRKKSPYPKTFDPKYELMVRQQLDKTICQSDAPLWQLTNRKTVMEMRNQEMQWPWYGQLMRRPQTMAYLLQLNFWLEYYSVELLF